MKDLGCCGIKNKFLKEIFFSGSTDFCYVFEFDTTDPSNEIFSFTYNEGTQIIEPLTIDLSAPVIDVITEIKAAIDGAGITYDTIDVEREPLGGGLFSYTITFMYPSVDITIIDISGTSYVIDGVSCSFDFLKDSEGNNILDNLDLPIITI